MTDREYFKAIEKNRRPGEGPDQQAARLGVHRNTFRKWRSERPALRDATKVLLAIRLQRPDLMPGCVA